MKRIKKPLDNLVLNTEVINKNNLSSSWLHDRGLLHLQYKLGNVIFINKKYLPTELRYKDYTDLSNYLPLSYFNKLVGVSRSYIMSMRANGGYEVELKRIGRFSFIKLPKEFFKLINEDKVFFLILIIN